MSRWILCALLGVTLVPCPAMAGVLLPKEPGAKPLAVRKQSIRVVVTDQVARATVDEVFENLSDKPLEGRYLLPLPEGAAISGFATWVDGQRVESRVEEKKDAEKTYQAAQQNGAQPALLEQTDPHTFATRVDGIPAKGTKRVEAQFAEILPYDSGTVTLRLPIAAKAGADFEPVGDFQVQLEVSDTKKIAELASTTPGVQIQRVGPSSFSVRMAARDVVPPPELVLSYRTESSKLGLSFATFKPMGETEGYFLLLASPQELTTDADIVQKDVVFVFDTSGSMGSAHKIDQARTALTRCLGYLNKEDRFGVVAFSDAVNPFRNKLIEASPDNVAAAQHFAMGLTAAGGTNISGALHAGMKMFEESQRPRVIVFMTDGVPTAGNTDPEQITSTVKAENTAGMRLFSFGVGSDVNRVLLEKLGRENRGAVDYVIDGQNIDSVIAGFYSKISKPVLSDLAFDFGEVTTTMQYPDTLPDLYKGSQLVVVGRYRGAGKVQAKLTGNLNGQKVSFPFEASFPYSADRDAFVARLWAGKRIDYLLSQIRIAGEREEAKNEVIALSKQFNIVTPYTSMVAVRSGPMVASVFPQRVKPGDPELFVRAARDAKVQVSIPELGISQVARWSEEKGLWTTRFLVPAGTPDGSYAIDVRITDASGHEERIAQRISIDTHAPAIAAVAEPVRAGQTALLHAQAVVSPLELASALVSRRDPYEAAKSLIDIRRVTAHLWDGRDVELALDPSGAGFVAHVETNSDLRAGSYPVTLTAQDYAGNVAQAQATVEVR